MQETCFNIASPNSTYININKSFNGLTNFSMEAFIKIKGTQPWYSGAIISSGDWNGASWGFNITQNNDGVQLWAVGTSGTTTINYSFQLNVWYRVSITVGSNLYSLYINGVLIGSKSISSNAIVTGASNTHIGNATYFDGFGFNGYVSDLRIWNIVLDNTSILKNWNKRFVTIPNGLIAYWKLNETSGTTVHDSTTNSNGVATTSLWYLDTIPFKYYQLKYLFLDTNNNIYKFNQTDLNLVNIGNGTPTNEMFQNYGVESLPATQYLNQLNKYKIAMFCDDSTETFKSKITTVPLPQIIKMKQPINITSVDGINSITSTINTSTYGKVKILISFDNINYYSFNGTDWILVDVNNKDDFNTNGMTKDILNSISSQQWNNKRGASNSLYFEYYMEINNVTDIANIDKIELNCNLKGKWDNAESKVTISGTIYGDYHYSYDSNSLLKVYLYKSGTYKINYPQ